MKNSLFLGFIFLMLLMVFSCSSSSSSSLDETSQEYTSAYTCPKYCKGSGSESPGACPVCKTKYVHNDLHGHTEDYDISHEDIHYN